MHLKDTKSGVVAIFLLVAIFASGAAGAPNLKSFEATVDKRLKQLIEVVKNATHYGSSIHKPGKETKFI